MKVELFNDNFQNFKRYGIPKAQLVIADIPYNLGNNAYASNPMWYVGGDNKNGESKKAGKAFFNTDYNFNIAVMISMFDLREGRMSLEEYTRLVRKRALFEYMNFVENDRDKEWSNALMQWKKEQEDNEC